MRSRCLVGEDEAARSIPGRKGVGLAVNLVPFLPSRREAPTVEQNALHIVAEPRATSSHWVRGLRRTGPGGSTPEPLLRVQNRAQRVRRVAVARGSQAAQLGQILALDRRLDRQICGVAVAGIGPRPKLRGIAGLRIKGS